MTEPRMTAAELIAKNVPTGLVSQRLADVSVRIEAGRSHSCVVLKEDRQTFIGLVRLQDIAGKSNPGNRIMGDLLGPITPMTVRLTESAAEVADLFLKHRLGEAVVLDNLDRYVGLITAESVLFWSLQQRVLPTNQTGIVSEASLEIPGSSRVPTAVVATPTTDRPILLVEDHVPSRQALVSILRRRKFNVLESASVGEALSLAKLHKIALVISDIELPDGSGFGLMKELQQHYGLKGIAVTGVSLAGDRVCGQAAGFMFHLKKPINVRELENAILAILAQPSGVVS